MTRLFFADVPEGPTCASCGTTCVSKGLYDENKDKHFCDMACLTEYISDRLEDFVEDYADNHVYELD